jgi:hypothetical protein
LTCCNFGRNSGWLANWSQLRTFNWNHARTCHLVDNNRLGRSSLDIDWSRTRQWRVCFLCQFWIIWIEIRLSNL